MQWDYIATREDELTAMAGEVILIAGEYKNAGWLWGARIINGQTGGFRLIPANYIEYQPDFAPNRSTSSLNSSTLNAPSNPSSLQTSTTLSSAHSATHPVASTQGQGLHDVNMSKSHRPPFLHGEFQNHAGTNSSMLNPAPPMIPGTAMNGQAPANVHHAGFPPTDEVKERERSSAPRDLGDMPPDSAAPCTGDPEDPFLDGMYEDESGLASVCC